MNEQKDLACRFAMWFVVNWEFYDDTDKGQTYLSIYDRWGNQVFETKDINAGWNGTYKNQIVQLETYGYYFEGECFQGEKITLKGNVTLVK